MKIKGNDIIIKMDGMAIASTKSCTIQSQCELIEITSPSTGDNKEFIPGKKSHTISCSYLVTNFKLPLKMVGKIVNIEIGSVVQGTRTLSNDKVTCSAIIQKCDVTANNNSIAKGSFNFQVSGPLNGLDEE